MEHCPMEEIAGQQTECLPEQGLCPVTSVSGTEGSNTTRQKQLCPSEDVTVWSGPYRRGSRKSKAFRCKELAPEGGLMVYMSHWGKEPEKYVIPLNSVHSLVRPVLTLFTAEVLFLICFDRNVNCTCILPPPLRTTHCVWILCIQT